MSISIPPPTAPRRVKVYELCRDEWTDRGTGYCSGEFSNNQPYVVVRNEENKSEILLKMLISGEIQFHKQQETLIVWSEVDKNDMALSFQEADGCSIVCDYLVFVQRYFAKKISIMVVTTTEEGDISELIAGPLIYPPSPTLENLEDVVESLSQLMAYQFARESVCLFITETDYIHQLVEVFNKAEQLENLNDLHNVCRVMKLLFSLNDSKVLESLIEDQNVVGVIGALEYDPDFPSLKANHRDYFTGDANFKEVVPIHDEEIVFKIKQTYRLQFLKDVLARLLDDSTFAIFTSMIFFNQISIVLALQSSTDYMNRLFNIYKEQGISENIEQRREGVRFVHQISLATKGSQNQQKKLTFTKLISSGLFSLLEFALNDTVESIRMLGTELLLTIIDIDASLIRNYVQTAQGHTTFALMQTLVELFFREDDIGLKSQAIETLKFMLDVVTHSFLNSVDDSASQMSSQELDNDVFVASFYTNCCNKLFSRLVEVGKGTGQDVRVHMSLPTKALYEQLCDLLNFCVRTHGAKCRQFSIENGLWKGISELIRCPHQQIQLAALRCLKQGLLLDDATYMHHFANTNLMESVVDVLIRMGNKNNLVNSACLELLGLVESGVAKPTMADNMKIVVNHLIESRLNELEKLTFTDISLKLLAFHSRYIEKDTIHTCRYNQENELVPLGRFSNVPTTEYSLNDKPAVTVSDESLPASNLEIVIMNYDDKSDEIHNGLLEVEESARLKNDNTEPLENVSKEGISGLKRREREDEEITENLMDEGSPQTRRLRIEASQDSAGSELKVSTKQDDSRVLSSTHHNKIQTAATSDADERRLQPGKEEPKRRLGLGSITRKKSSSPTKKSEGSTGGIKKTIRSAGKLFGGLGKSKGSSPAPQSQSPSATPSATKK